MKKMILGLMTLVLMVMVMTSCSVEPKNELTAANQAMEAAKGVEADRYLASEFAALNDSLTAVIAAIDVEKAKGMTERNYKPLAEKLTWITASAETLLNDTEARKAEMRTTVEAILAELSTELNQNKEVLGKIQKNARNAEVIDAIANELAVIDASVSDVNTLIANGDYLTAFDKLTAARDREDLLHTRLMAYSPK
jgi:hypothetical protein